MRPATPASAAASRIGSGIYTPVSLIAALRSLFSQRGFIMALASGDCWV